MNSAAPKNLFIVTPDPELTKFEQEVRDCIVENLTSHGREMSSTVFIDDDTAKKMAAELLDLVRKEQSHFADISKMERLNVDALREWSMRFAPDIRGAIESTAYHFWNLAINAMKEQQ